MHFKETSPHFGFGIPDLKIRVFNRSGGDLVRGDAMALDHLLSGTPTPTSIREGAELSWQATGVTLPASGTMDSRASIIVILDEDIDDLSSGLCWLQGGHVPCNIVGGAVAGPGEYLFCSGSASVNASPSPAGGNKLLGFAQDVGATLVPCLFDGFHGVGQS